MGEGVEAQIKAVLTTWSQEFRLNVQPFAIVKEKKIETYDDSAALIDTFLTKLCDLESSISMKKLKSERDLLKYTEDLKYEVSKAQSAAEDIGTLQSKVQSYINVYKTEQKAIDQEMEQHHQTKAKIILLGEHVQKITNAMKFESTSKLKAEERSRLEKRECLKLKKQASNLKKIVKSQAETLKLVKDGSKIIEDQLRLMDLKYLELQSKIEVASKNQKLHVEKAQKEVLELQLKLASYKNDTETMDRLMPLYNTMNSQSSPKKVRPRTTGTQRDSANDAIDKQIYKIYRGKPQTGFF